MNQPACKEELQKFCDPEFADYLGDVTSNQQAIDRAIDGWADALEQMCTPILPVSSTVAAAKAAFKAAAVGMYISGAVFSAAAATFASVMSAGMAGYSVTQPTFTLIPVFAGDNHELMCDAFATQVQAWLATGTATLLVPPFTVVNWS